MKRNVGSLVPLEIYDRTQAIIQNFNAQGGRTISLSDAMVNGLALFNEHMERGGAVTFHSNKRGAPRKQKESELQ